MAALQQRQHTRIDHGLEGPALHAVPLVHAGQHLGLPVRGHSHWEEGWQLRSSKVSKVRCSAVRSTNEEYAQNCEPIKTDPAPNRNVVPPAPS